MDQELKELLKKLKEKTGVEFSVTAEHPGGHEDTVNSIKALLSEQHVYRSKSEFLLHILKDNPDSSNIREDMRSLHMNEKDSYILFLVTTDMESGDLSGSVLQNMFHSPVNSFVIRTDFSHLVLLLPENKKCRPESLHSTAESIVDTLNSEAMVSAIVSYTQNPKTVFDLNASYGECSLAARIGAVFYAPSNVFSCEKLGVARLIYELPLSVCKKYLQEIFGDKKPSSFDEETLTIIRTFFENGLNISETSRKLYMHRNTLVYRLEKISRATGLDIRNFEDAVTYQLASMISDYVRFLEQSAG